MSCTDVVDLVVDYLEGDLEPDQRGSFEAHIDGCSHCADFLADYEHTSEVCRDALAEAMPDSVLERLTGFLANALKDD